MEGFRIPKTTYIGRSCLLRFIFLLAAVVISCVVVSLMYRGHSWKDGVPRRIFHVDRLRNPPHRVVNRGSIGEYSDEKRRRNQENILKDKGLQISPLFSAGREQLSNEKTEIRTTSATLTYLNNFSQVPPTVESKLPTTVNPLIPEAFRPVMTEDNKRMMLDLMTVFDRVATKLKIPYFLISGSALGAYRHEGFVPWDDDVDLAVRMKNRHELFDHLEKLDNYHQWTTTGDFQWKFWHENSNQLWTKWKWPYLDVFFYKENRTHVWFNEMGKITYGKKTDVFPLKRVKFESILAPVPKNLTKFCKAYFHTKDFSMCKSNGYLHSLERTNEARLYRTRPCEQLKPFFFFADRTNGNI